MSATFQDLKKIFLLLTPYLVGGPALVGAEHDGVGGVLVELLELHVSISGQELHVGAAACQAIREFDIVLQRQALRRIRHLRQCGGDAVVARLLRHLHRCDQTLDEYEVTHMCSHAHRVATS